jgi:gas vesicle protein GvpL/GvpF
MSEADPLARLLAAVAREDGATLLDEARAAARERVRERLTEELTRRMLEQVAAAAPDATASEPPTAADVSPPAADPVRPAADPPPPAPDPPPPAADRAPPPSAERDPAAAHGVYVYAIVDRAVDAALPEGVAGTPVRSVRAADGALTALVSDVSLEEFGDEALRRNLNELEWLTATAVAHETVVDAALAATTVVPMRLCTIFRDDAAVGEMLARERGDLEATLARLQGTHEWGVKVVADAEALNDAVARESERLRELRSGIGAVGEGAGYFASRELERATREEADAELERRARDIHEALVGIALDARVNPPSNRELAGYQGDMVLNGAYLVAHERTEELRALVDRLGEEHGAHGLGLDLTGPWPPYNFSTLAGVL